MRKPVVTVTDAERKKRERNVEGFLSFLHFRAVLGLPGSDSPPLERKSGSRISLFSKDLQSNHNNTYHSANNGFFSSSSLLKNNVARAKRAFSDAIDEKWGFSVSDKIIASKADLGKEAYLFYLRGGENLVKPPLVSAEAYANLEQKNIKDGGIVQEKKKSQVIIFTTNEHRSSPVAAKL